MQNKISPSKTVFFLFLSFVLGVFFAPFSIFLGLALVSFFYLFLKERLVVLFCMVLFLSGAFCFLHSFDKASAPPQTPLAGEVVEVSAQGERSTRITLDGKEGRVFLYTDPSFNYKKGDVLVVEGEFTRSSFLPHMHASFYPEVEKVGEKRSFFRETLNSFRERLRGNIRGEVPAPQSFLLEAMVLGERDSFSPELNEKLSFSGTRHITAISGMHVVIISSLLFLFFAFLGVSRRVSALLSMVCIFLFVIFVGAPVSAIRAGSMGGALLLSSFFLRETSSLRLMALIAFIMLLSSPLLLHFDLGFQLSFLAVIGIICFQKPLKEGLMRSKILKGNEKLSELLGVTLSAQIPVAPLILYNFGHFPLFSAVVNIIIVPLLPFIMGLGFLTGLTGAFVFSFPAHLLLSFVFFVIETVAMLPFAAIYIEEVPLYFILFLYGIIICGALVYFRGRVLKVADGP